MSKQIKYCILVSLLAVFATVYITCEYILNEKQNYSFRLHTTAQMIDLDDIINNNIDDIKFVKAVNIYSSILHFNEIQDVDEYKDWCDYMHENYEQELIDIIEGRTEIPSEQKIKFSNGFKKLEKLCTDIKK